MSKKPTILHISSSSNLKSSVTRDVGSETLNELKKKYPEAQIIERDLVKNPLPHITPEMVDVLYTPGSPELAFSDKLVSELKAADIILIEVPMYNFGIPSALKAWVDHVARKGETFKYDESGPEGLLKNKQAILVLGRGGIYSEGSAKGMDHQEPYMRTILGFMGISEVKSIYVEGVARGPEKATESIKNAKENAHSWISKIDLESKARSL